MSNCLTVWYQIGGVRTNCYLTYTPKKVNIELAIWDAAGQERFHCISPVSISVLSYQYAPHGPMFVFPLSWSICHNHLCNANSVLKLSGHFVLTKSLWKLSTFLLLTYVDKFVVIQMYQIMPRKYCIHSCSQDHCI